MMLKLVAWFLALVPAIPLAVYSLEVLTGLRRLRRAQGEIVHGKAAILIPAHNEAATIGDTVRRVISLGVPGLRLLVVADNCSDETAHIARAGGAEVIERTDTRRRGKGFALAFGRDHLAADPPQVVLVLDADCRTDRQGIEHLVSAALYFGAPVQASNLLEAPPGAEPIVQISNFAMLVKNSVRARGLYRLGGGIPLFGTGMAFPWALFSEAPLASSDTVEDLRLCLDFAERGVRVHLVECARVTSASAAAQDTVAQRRRWEHGFMRMAFTYALPLLLQGAARLSRHRFMLGLHLCVPPLALLMLLGAAACLLAACIGLATGYWLPACTILAALAISLLATLVAWSMEGRHTLTPGALMRAPLYVLRKLPIYLGLLTSHQKSWNRTPRNRDRP